MAKAHTLVDNFNDNSTDSKWTVFASPTPASDRVREVNGRVEMRPRSGSSGQYSGYFSTVTYDLTGSSAHVELVQALPAFPGNVTSFLATSTGNNDIFFNVEAGQLKCLQAISSVFTQLESIPYDPVAHRWLRLRERGGTTLWETSPDCRVWSVVVSTPNPFSLTAVKLQFQVGSTQAVASPGLAVFDNFNVPESGRTRRIDERRLAVRELREQTAELASEQVHPEHVNNGDEAKYVDRPFIGSYSKSLRHDSLGDPNPISYGTLLRALQSEDPVDFEAIHLVPDPAPPERPTVKLTNPQAGLAFELEGADAQEPTMPPAPRFDSEQTAHEAGELYWMAVLRDVPFVQWGTNTTITSAINSLNSEFPAFGGTTPVTVQNVFRGIYPGEQVGPYVSQFLLKGNVDPRKADTQGRDADEGFITYGAQRIDQRILPAKPNVDFLTVFSTWLDVQNGRDKRGQDEFDTSRRFLHTLRAGATYVHFDQVLNAFYNAAFLLMSEPTGNQLAAITGTGRPMIDLEFPKDEGTPESRTEIGFATFGPIHLLQVLGEVLGRALRAVWWQKWGVHRRLRPEEYGGRVHNHVNYVVTSGTGGRWYPLHTSIINSLHTGGLSGFFGNTGEKFSAGYLLPQAYPEGAPTHPSYGSGHAAGAGACATILKAFFDESAAIENPVQAASDGLTLSTYTGADATQMTVGGELNKLAGNIAIFRNAAGVHWRSDYTESLPLGEAVAIRLLQEMSLTFNEDDAFFELTRFDGQKIRIFDGKVVPV